MTREADTRDWFVSATEGLVALLPGLVHQLDRPALGVWDVRALLGHTGRALLTVESYLSAGRGQEPDPTLTGPADYYRAAFRGLADPEEVAARGVRAGRELGPDPAGAVREDVERVVPLVLGTPDTAAIATPVGVMRLDAYLPTRALELSLHSLDLARATGQAVPAPLASTVPACLSLVAELGQPEQHLQLLLAATGRADLPAGFSLL